MDYSFKYLVKSHRLLYPFLTILFLGVYSFSYKAQAQYLRIGVFKVDATPPIGSPVAYATTRSITDSLSARGLVILSEQKPIVLCAVDWIAIGNEGLDVWKERLAKAANTNVDRVSVHVLHQHDAPWCDFTFQRIVEEYGIEGIPFDRAFLLRTIENVALAVEKAKMNAQIVTNLGFGEAKVEKVASNRRILGKDGKVAIVRFSSSTDSQAIAAPEGVIDPWLKCVSFWNKEKPIAVLTYYATHPQSYYGTGDVSCDFVGIGRNAFEKVIGVPCIHFNGAGGNIAAGKYNDGSHEVRPILADRMEVGMIKAWKATKKIPVSGKDLVWKSQFVALPISPDLKEDEVRANLKDMKKYTSATELAATKLAWLIQSQAGRKVQVSSLRLGNVWLLNIPGEAFVEYQLAAQALRPNDHVCTAAYEEYGPEYIGTKIAYSQGGFEIPESFVAPEVEGVLMGAINEVLK
ncbi:MAG: hypothetical protein ABI288_07405 [Ginsengibacter sp.]